MGKEELKEILILHKMWLSGEIKGIRANLYMANLYRADLCRANLSGANLSGADLCMANLSGADLSRANLSGADLYMADLCRANLSGADLSGADLSRANLSGADLSRANLSGADLSGADLSGAKLKEKLKIKSKKYAYYQGSDYHCNFFGSIIKIGCEVHYAKDWQSFDNKRIMEMDQERALKFWKREKETILLISKKLNR